MHISSISFFTIIKVAPVRRITIPRLELWAALIGAELSQYVKKACGLGRCEAYYWTDSTIAIHWIKRDPDASKQYVANRVLSIRELCEGAIWRHVEGIHNPADLLTRGFSAESLKSSTLWFNGPAWLILPQG